jgi:hypothetical protein
MSKTPIYILLLSLLIICSHSLHTHNPDEPEQIIILDRSVQLNRFKELVNKINSDPSSTWRAHFDPEIINDFLDSPTNNRYTSGVIHNYGKNSHKFKFGTKNLTNLNQKIPQSFKNSPFPRVEHNDIDVNDLPLNFDSLQLAPQCADIVNYITDQSNCGSCWAVSTSSSLSHRYCIKNPSLQPHRFFSSRELISNCHTCGFGCGGGTLPETFLYTHNIGLVSGHPGYQNYTGCLGYPFPPCSHHVPDSPLPPCDEIETHTPPVVDQCDEASMSRVAFDKDHIQCNKPYHVWGTNDVKKEIFKNGSIQATFNVYEDFLLYKDGIYQKTKGSRLLGGHAVVMRGWGYDLERNLNYTLVQNSWNASWGENGYVRFKMGLDNAGIEDDGMACEFLD